MPETYREAYDRGRGILLAAGIAEADTEARLLLEAVCLTSRATLYATPERPLREEEAVRFRELLGKRATRIPLAYLTGVSEFMGLPFSVNEHVLIPRQDTETLVEEAMPQLLSGMHFLDLCTGSGCVALSLLKYSHDTVADATDISAEALEVAANNAETLGLSGRIRLMQCDLYPPLAKKPEKGYDLIIANPPYIRDAEISRLMPEVRDHEPHLALAGGADGLDFYRRILKDAPAFLARGALLLTETGYDQADAVAAMYEEAHFWHVRKHKDLNGILRVVSGSWRENRHI
ncbi:MAG: peptide chain release factor N(5)-glutamine methyltransferase [Lachnospiraceae bacterium]|nr:peptide chain release factor N(5)-glutamine methyltransferase [Lachnospiraceae bacterium]